MLFEALRDALAFGDARQIAAVVERIAGIIDETRGDPLTTSGMSRLVTTWENNHPHARCVASAELGRLAALADLIAAGNLAALPTATQPSARPTQKRRPRQRDLTEPSESLFPG